VVHAAAVARFAADPQTRKRTAMTEYIKTAGDLRRGIAHLADDEPIEFFLNAVETHAYFAVSGVEGGDAANINVEPNYTCGAPPDPLPVVPEHKGP
jgi:hypothetical protein